MIFIDNYKGRHLTGTNLLELINQLKDLSSQKVTKCLMSLDKGKTWLNSLNGGAIPINTIETTGVPFETLVLSITSIDHYIAFSITLPKKSKPEVFRFTFIAPVDSNSFIIDTIRSINN